MVAGGPGFPATGLALSMRPILTALSLLLLTSASGAERRIDFSNFSEGENPPGFRSALNGEGPAGEWKILRDEVPPLLKPFTPGGPAIASKAVLAQVSSHAIEERFPLLILEDQTFRDFTFTARFKTVGGQLERMAGLAFRIQNETNYYVVRASSIGNTFRFYKVVNGQRGQIFGPQIPIPSGTWHELTVECEGTQIRCFLNGQQVIPTLTDSTFASGKLGFWTKSDSVSYFADPVIRYKPIEPPAQTLVRETLNTYERLLGLKLFVRGAEPETTRVVGAKLESDLGSAGGAAEWDVIQNGNFYYGKGKKSVSVTMPLRDRNGDIIAAARLEMTTFAGQTERNAVERAAPIVRSMQRRVQTLQDLVE